MMKSMKLVQVVAGVLMIAGLSACETVDTPDGKIPAQYLDVAKILVGTYQGQFNHVSGELSLKLDGDMPVLTYTDARGHDLLGPECGSLIGKLAQLGISMNDQVGSASFEFSPGKCTLEGRAVNLEFSQGSDGIALSVSVVSGHSDIWIPGDMDCSTGPNGHMHCHSFPGHHENVYEFIKGSFKKVN